MSAEARLSGKILGALPVLLVATISVINPTFYADVPQSTGLQIAMGVAAGMVVVGWLLLRKFTNLKA
jgi:tight adherence protein B